MTLATNPSQSKPAEEREKQALTARPNLDTRKTGRKLVRPRLERSREQISDVDMLEIEGATTMEEPNAAPSHDPEIQGPLLKKLQGSDSPTTGISTEEQAAQSSEIPEKLPNMEETGDVYLASSEEFVDIVKDEEMDNETDPTEELKEPLDSSNQGNLRNESTAAAELLVEKAIETDEVFDDVSKGLELQDQQYSALEAENETEEGELVLGGTEQQEVSDIPVNVGDSEARESQTELLDDDVDALAAEVSLGEGKNKTGEVLKEVNEAPPHLTHISPQLLSFSLAPLYLRFLPLLHIYQICHCFLFTKPATLTVPLFLGSFSKKKMGNADFAYPAATVETVQRVAVPPPQPFFKSFTSRLKETFFPDDPLRQFKNQSPSRKLVLGLQYFLPILEWAPRYTFDYFKSDLIAGITIASLAIPQGISYANLAKLPPILGLYSSFVPPLIYAMMGSSRDLAVGTVAVASLLIASMLGKEVSPTENPKLYMHLAFTATFFAGVFQAGLGFLRLGFIVDFLSHATIVGFMAGAATVVCLQQLKGILGLNHFTTATDIISVMRSVFSQTHEWRWESAVLGCGFLFFLLLTRYFSKRRPKFFWISAAAPLTSVILGSILCYLTHAEKHGVQVIGHLKKGLNPLSVSDFTLTSPYMMIALKTGVITGIIALAEGIAVGRSFAMFKNYNIDGNKEMIAFGMMNIVGSCSSCYLTTGPFSRSAVNYNAGCKTAVSNIVMATAVMITLLFLTPLFHYTPMVVLSSIIISAMLGLIDYEAAIHLWGIDKADFCVCMGAYLGVVFGSVEIGLVIAVTISVLRLLLFVARPRTCIVGNIPNTSIYRNVDQYPAANTIPAILILQIDAPIYFANASYLRERISRWVNEEEDKMKMSGETSLQYVILDFSAVGTIDTSGIDMLEELKKNMDRRGLQVALANPGSEVMKKLEKARFLTLLGEEWIFLTVEDAVRACNFMLHTCKPARDNNDVV